MKIQSIAKDYTDIKTELCELGAIFNTDKSPYHTDEALYKHAYTGFYYEEFSAYKYKDIAIAEIGIESNASTKMFRKFFTKARIDLYEYIQEKINKALEDDLWNVSYTQINVMEDQSIKTVFGDKKYQFIIDDSTHVFEDEIRIIHNCIDNLVSGGKIIIEDIFRNDAEEKYLDYLAPIEDKIADITFVTTDHELEYTPGWNNSKLLVVTKK